jgi:hypothetical protein
MEKMSTEEYYGAINRRIAEMKKKRQQEPGFKREAADDYINSLSRKN